MFFFRKNKADDDKQEQKGKEVEGIAKSGSCKRNSKKKGKKKIKQSQDDEIKSIHSQEDEDAHLLEREDDPNILIATGDTFAASSKKSMKVKGDGSVSNSNAFYDFGISAAISQSLYSYGAGAEEQKLVADDSLDPIASTSKKIGKKSSNLSTSTIIANKKVVDKDTIPAISQSLYSYGAGAEDQKLVADDSLYPIASTSKKIGKKSSNATIIVNKKVVDEDKIVLNTEIACICVVFSGTKFSDRNSTFNENGERYCGLSRE